MSSGAAFSTSQDILLICVLFLVFLIVVFFIVRRIQKRLDPRRSRPIGDKIATSMEQIEKMRMQGLISDDEFAVLRKRLIIQGQAEYTAEKGLVSSSSVPRIGDFNMDEPTDSDNQAQKENT